VTDPAPRGSRDEVRQGREPSGSRADERLPTTDEMIAGVAGELRRHARVLRRVLERALDARTPDQSSGDAGTGPSRPGNEGPPDVPPKLGEERDGSR
jgi:hypothetical protein